MNEYDVLIIGAGPAGLTAAIYVQRAGYRSLVLEEYVYGGQMSSTPEVENYPAVGKISGAELGMNLYNQAVAYGAQVEFDGVTQCRLSERIKTVETQSGKTYTARAIIIANGAKRRKLDINGEEQLAGKGVSYCATCDGGFYKGKTTAVIGGGNTALEDALYLSNICEKVYLIHRRDAFRAGRVLIDSLQSRPNIEVLYDTVPLEILPEEQSTKVGALVLQNKKAREHSTISVQGVFVAIGLKPDNGIFSTELTLDKAGYIVAGEDTKTNLVGVYAAGDTRTKSLRQIVTAAGDGAVAAFEAGNYLNAAQT